MHIKNVKWHFFGSLLSLYVSVQTPTSNNQILSAWFRNWRRSLQTLEMSGPKWSQRWIPGMIVLSTRNEIFEIRAYPSLSSGFRSVSAKSNSVWCSGRYLIPTSFPICLCLKWLKRGEILIDCFGREAEAGRHHPLWPGGKQELVSPGDKTKLPCLI